MNDGTGDSFATNKFPWKLWRIVNDCDTNAIGWGDDGKTIVLHKAQFQREYLDPPNKSFKTSNIGSFIRQLNLYGFKKVQPPSRQYMFDLGVDQDIQEFQSECFVRNNPDLVGELRRHVGVRRAREQAAKRRYALSESIDNMKSKVQRTDVIRIEHTDSSRLQKAYISNVTSDYSSKLSHGHGEKHHSTPDNRPCMLAVPIYADGLPYIHPQVPPVLVEWDGKGKEWVATGPAFDVPSTSLLKHRPGPAGDTISGGALSNMSSEEFNRLVHAVSDALRKVPDNQLQSYLRDCQIYHNRHRSRSGTPSSLDSFNSISTDMDECPYPSSIKSEPLPKRVYKPGESLLRVITPIPMRNNVPLSLSSPMDIKPSIHVIKTNCMFGHHHAAMHTPLRSHSAPIFSPPSRQSGVFLPSPITSKDVDFSVHQRELLSPMSVKCEDEGPAMDLSPMQHDHISLSAVCREDELKIDLDADDRRHPFEGVCEF